VAQQWLQTQLHTLKHNGPATVIAEVAHLVAKQTNAADLATHLAYLEKRQAHMDYPSFLAAGWPIGDGAVESANKLVVEARLKGSGMHWARPHVDPMVALRNIVCNDRWDEAWPQIVKTLRRQAQQHRTSRRQLRRAAKFRAASETTATAPVPQTLTAQPSSKPPPSTPPVDAVLLASGQLQTPDGPSQPRQPWRPPANHPWRHMPVGKARFKRSTQPGDAKL
jgi:hypothetical protein